MLQRELAARLLLRRRLFFGLLLGGVLLLASGGAYTGTHKINETFSLPYEQSRSERARKTPTDLYFEKHGTIPRPRVMHAVLDSKTEISSDKKGILVIGDVHGCFQELQMLHKAAQKNNDDFSFRFVILVGDLTMKGPESARVVRFVREQPDWLAVRGNNDNEALKAMLGDFRKQKKLKYKWIVDGEKSAEGLSDEDVMWLSELPYTITIPSSLLNVDSSTGTEHVDTTIVHAGLIPGVKLQDQTVTTMVTVREVEPLYQDASFGRQNVTYAQHMTQKGHRKESQVVQGKPIPWASVWRGPNRVIFGHDAKRGLQLYGSEWATGIDTGAVYGKQLTGIILPDRWLVHIDALKASVTIR